MIANLTAVMDGLAARAVTLIPNTYAYPVDNVTVPCAIVGYPTRIEFDLTMDRGGDEMTLPLWVLVGKSMTAAARDALSTLLGDTSSIKSAVDGAYAWGDARIVDAEVTEVTVAAVPYLAVKFTVDVI